jgi:hypothetical protein
MNTTTRRRALWGTLIALFSITVGFALLAGSAPKTASADIPGCWTVYPSVLGPGPNQNLTGMAAISSNDVWAAGYSGVGPQTNPVALHWDGFNWTSTPTVGNGYFAAVAAASSNDVWAVGGVGSVGIRQTLVEHWDGTSWSVVPSANVNANTDNSLSGVAALASNDVWAIGNYNDGISNQTLVEHWNGTAWTIVSSPNTNPMENFLYGISAVSPTDIWVVGGDSLRTGLIMHWDGAAWSFVPGVIAPELHGIVALAADNVWAVGDYFNDRQMAVMHYDGHGWAYAQAPTVPSSYLNTIAAVGPNDIWAAGFIGPISGPFSPLIVHWDGTNWSTEPNPSGYSSASLTGSTTVGGDLWQVGSATTGGPNQTIDLKLRHAAGCTEPTTPVPPTQTQPPTLTTVPTSTVPVASSPTTQPVPSSTATPRGPLNPPVPLPGTGSRYFPETGHAVSGIFLDYWNGHGGLAQQGYPISDVIGEVSDLNGRLYTVQYFERAVFEYHPEYRPPFNVLLSQLGTFEYKRKYPNGAPNQRPNNDPGTVLFKETGHHLGGRFLQYWRDNGGLMQQGFPISDEFTEVSPTNGKPYTVQYFERAVFEWHPENERPYDVLLSLLGRFRWDEKYVSPPPSPTVGPVGQLIATNVFGNVAANDRYIFWVSNSRSSFTVFGYDTFENRQFIISGRPGFKSSLTADDRTVAWLEGDVGGIASIRGYDLIDGRELTLVPNSGSSQLSEDRMSIDGAMLYYVGKSGDTYGIITRNWTTGEQNLLIEDGRNPVVSGDVLLWTKRVVQCDPFTPCRTEQQFYVRKANTDRLVSKGTTQAPFDQYNAHGDNAVYIPPNLDGQSSSPYLYNIAAGTTRQMADVRANHPLVRDNVVVWAALPQSGPSNLWTITQYDANTSRSTQLAQFQTDRFVATQALLAKKAVAYTVGDQGIFTGDLYLLNLSTP